MKTIILSLFTLFLSINTLLAQQRTVQGVVLEADSQEPLQAATVTLLNAADGSMIGYALADEKGKFSIATTTVGTFKVTVSFMGFKTQTTPAIFDKSMTFRLDKDMITLKEVQINPSRIWARQDTIHYDLSKFATSKDQNIKDVLKKLPGVNVEENGQVRYNGKPISNFYVEGLDITGGKYNQINNNLRADAVKSAEIIEHHQPIKALQDKVFTDDVALNLKLKPDARSQWLLTASLEGGYGDELLYNTNLNALQLGAKQQTLYNYKNNNSGVDLAIEQQELASGSSSQRLNDRGAPRFISPSYISMPIAKSRLLFNQDHILSANRLFKTNNESQLRFQLGYNYSDIHQQSGYQNTYYSAVNNIQTAENKEYRLRTDLLTGELNYERNALSSYSNNRLMFQGSWGRGVANISGDQSLTQDIKSSELEVKNLFNKVYSKENYTLGLTSFMRYSYLPSTLAIDNMASDMNVHNAYTDNSLYWLRKRNGLSLQMTARFKGELSSVTQNPNPMIDGQNGNEYRADNFTLSYTPQIEWEKGHFQTTLTAPLQWKRLPNQSYSLLSVDPSLFIRYEFNNRWKAYIFGSMSRTAGELPEFYPGLYRQDYRTMVQQTEIVPEVQQQAASLYLEHKNTVQEFFWTLAFNYAHQQKNTLFQRTYDQGNFLLSSVFYDNAANVFSINSMISKGFYDWHLKTSLELNIRSSEGKQMNQGVAQSFKNESISFTPRIIWTPFTFFEANYEANIACNSSSIGENTRLDPLWSVSQRLSLNYGISNTEFQISGQHFYNDLSATKHTNLFLADASIAYKTGKWRFNISANNIFNKQQYSYTLYSDIESRTSWTNIRPREFLFGVRVQL